MKKMKKLLSIISSIAVILAMMPAMALADGGNTGAGNELQTVTEVGNTNAFTSAVENGGAIKLTEDIKLSTTTVNLKDCTIDLNGHNIVAEDCRALHVKSGTVSITGEGEISANKVQKEKNFNKDSSVIRVGDNDLGQAADVTLNIGEDVIVSSNHCYGVTVFGSKTTETVVIDGTVNVTGENTAVSGNGSSDYGGTTITINGTVKATQDNAIYHPQSGTLTINGIVEGGIEAKAGSTVINSKASVTARNITKNHTRNNNGCSTVGYAIALVENDVYTGNPEANIQGGNIEGQIVTFNDNTHEYGCDKEVCKQAKITITGGTFSLDPTKYVAEGNNSIYHMGNGKYVVAESAPAHTAGYNAWTQGEGNTYNEIYIAPVEDPVVNTGTTDNAATEVDAVKKTTTTEEGKTETKIDADLGDKIVKAVKENNSTDVKIEATTAKGDSTASTVSLPETTVKEIANSTEAAITVKTDTAEVTLDKEALDAIADKAGTTGEVKLVVETVENTAEKVVIDLKIETSNGKVTDFKGGNASVTVPLTDNLKGKEVVCVYIDDNGIYHNVNGILNEDGTYTFKTGHFSTYAIMEKEDADTVIKKQTSDAQKAKIKKVKTTVNLTTKKVKTGVKVTVKVPASQKADKAGILIYRAAKKDGKYSVVKKAVTSKSTYTVTNKKTVKGKRYYYKARAYKVIDGKTYYGKMSSVKSIKAK